MKRLIDVAAGREKADLVLKNARIVNVFSGEILPGDVAVADGVIAGIGRYEADSETDLEGRYLMPGFIDGHVHIESSMVTPLEFAKAVIPKGTTTVIADPHEIANVCGIDGIRFLLDQSDVLPLSIFIMLPSSVPATPFETSGAELRADELRSLIGHRNVLGLGEVMNYPALVSGDPAVLDKLAVVGDMVKDGHAPGLAGRRLQAYRAAGITTEHECATVQEMMEKLRCGMYVHMREGSAARNLRTLVKAVNRDNLRRVLFCTDDRHPEDILLEGHIDNNIRLAIREGLSPVDAIRIATLNAAECYGLKDRGALAPGYTADMVVVDDLDSLAVQMVYIRGRLVASGGSPLFEIGAEINSKAQTVHIGELTRDKLQIEMKSDIARVIRVIPGSLETESVIRRVGVENGLFQFHEKLDILKLAVVERHGKNGNIGLGLVEDFRLKNGAIASTVAHDSHNLIVIGDNDDDMLVAIEEIRRMGGGIVIVSKGRVLQSLPLPIAGLMSDRPLAEVSERLREMLAVAYGMGVNPGIQPFMTLSFLALPVIPDLKVTDFGLFDVGGFRFTDLSLEV